MKKFFAVILFLSFFSSIYSQTDSGELFNSEIINKSYYTIEIDGDVIPSMGKKTHSFPLRNADLYDGWNFTYKIPLTEKVYYEHTDKIHIVNHQKNVLIENPIDVNDSGSFIVLRNSSSTPILMTNGLGTYLKPFEEGCINRNEWNSQTTYILPESTVVYKFSGERRISIEDTEKHIYNVIDEENIKRGYIYIFEFLQNAVTRKDARPIIKLLEPTWEFPLKEDTLISDMCYDQINQKIFFVGEESGKPLIQALDPKMSISRFDTEEFFDCKFTNLMIQDKYIYITGEKGTNSQSFILKYTKDGEKIGQALYLDEHEKISDTIQINKDTFAVTTIKNDGLSGTLTYIKDGKKMTRQEDIFELKPENTDDIILSLKILFDNEHGYIWLAVNYENSYSKIYRINTSDRSLLEIESEINLFEINKLIQDQNSSIYVIGVKDNSKNTILKIQNTSTISIEEYYTIQDKGIKIYDACISNNYEFIFCGGMEKTSITQQLAPLIRSINLTTTDISWENTFSNTNGNIRLIATNTEYGFISLLESIKENKFTIIRLNDCGNLSDHHQKYESSVTIKSNVYGELIINEKVIGTVMQGEIFSLSLVPQKYVFEVRNNSGKILDMQEITLTGNSSKKIELNDNSKQHETKQSAEIKYIKSNNGRVLEIAGSGELNEQVWLSDKSISVYDVESIYIRNGITSIGDNVFSGYKNLSYIELPESLEKIGSKAFYECEHLSSIHIPHNVHEIGEEAFSGCLSLKNIFIPESVHLIMPDAFARCSSLESIDVSEKNIKYKSIYGILYSHDETELILYPSNMIGYEFCISNKVKTIHTKAFANQNYIEKIIIGNNVREIGDYAFSNCKQLQKFVVSESNKWFKSVDGVLFNYACSRLISYPIWKDSIFYTISSSVSQIEASAFCSVVKLETLFFESEKVPNVKTQYWSKCNFKIVVQDSAVDAYKNHLAFNSVKDHIISNSEYQKQVKKDETSMEIQDFFTPYQGAFSMEAGLYYNNTRFIALGHVNFPNEVELDQPKFGIKFNPLVISPSASNIHLLIGIDYSYTRTKLLSDVLIYNELDCGFMLGINLWQRRVALRTGIGYTWLWETVDSGIQKATNLKSMIYIPVDFEIRVCKFISLFAEYKYGFEYDISKTNSTNNFDLQKHSFNIGIIFNTTFKLESR
ncbi:MAG: leucine-rich repeat protein [Treponema sp.]|nr:leucine-rich repeat protein [Treponema sp.]